MFIGYSLFCCVPFPSFFQDTTRFWAALSVIYHFCVWFMWFKRAFWRYLALFLCVFLLFVLSVLFINNHRETNKKSLKQTKMSVTIKHIKIFACVSHLVVLLCLFVCGEAKTTREKKANIYLPSLQKETPINSTQPHDGITSLEITEFLATVMQEHA